MADQSGDLRVIRWLVAVQARNLGYQCEVVAPDAVAVTAANGERQELALAPLHQAITGLPRAQWTAAVDEFLEVMFKGPAPTESLDVIRSQLRTKLIPEEAARGSSVVRGEFGQDLVEGLVLDRALVMEWVSDERAAAWGVPEYELLLQGRDNVRAGGRLDVSTAEVNGVPVTMLSGDDYASTHLFWLDEYRLVGVHGALVSVPSRTQVFAVPIVAGTNGFNYLDAIVRLTLAAYQEAEHPVVPRIYHWDPDTMEAMDQVLGAALLHIDGSRVHVIVNPAWQESQEALDA